MGYYVVRRGDCLSSIANSFGFSDYQTIYQRPENADFRQKRPNPNIICPGDVLFIPDRETKEVPAETDRRHEFVLRKESVKLRLRLEDDLHQPYKNTKYHLRVDSQSWDASTDANGMLEQEIAANATQGEITIFPAGVSTADDGYSFPLQLGDLDPIDEMTGVDARLCNLGYAPADAGDSLSDDDRKEALKAFQSHYGLEVTGDLTEETRNKLRETHDGE